MSPELEIALSMYLDPKIISRQFEMEMIVEARSRQAILDIAQADSRSRSFLDAVLREREVRAPRSRIDPRRPLLCNPARHSAPGTALENSLEKQLITNANFFKLAP
jgi:hypothetical protein